MDAAGIEFEENPEYGYDICGDRNQTLNAQDRENVENYYELGALNQKNFISIEELSSSKTLRVTFSTIEEEDKGEHFIKIKSWLQEYSNITSSEATIYLTFYQRTTSLQMQNDAYTIGHSDPIEIEIPVIEFDPNLESTVANMTYQAQVKRGQSFYDISNNLNLGFLLGELDEEARQLVIQTEDTAAVGLQVMRIKYTMDGELQGQFFYSDEFIINVQPDPDSIIEFDLD